MICVDAIMYVFMFREFSFSPFCLCFFFYSLRVCVSFFRFPSRFHVQCVCFSFILLFIFLIHRAAGGGGDGGPGFGKLVITGVAAWIMGAKVHSSRTFRKIKSKHQKEQKQLYSQYYNDVYKLSEQNTMLEAQAEELKELVRSTEAAGELEALQRDYDEFKQPDLDGDDRISRSEFTMYVKDYLSNYPGLSEKDYPKFDDFDHDGDGFVSFQEYSQQMALQAQQAELEELYSGVESDKAQALKDMYQSTAGGRY
jgi:Ca2+-binding EF-hand superfamily protein